MEDVIAIPAIEQVGMGIMRPAVTIQGIITFIAIHRINTGATNTYAHNIVIARRAMIRVIQCRQVNR